MNTILFFPRWGDYIEFAVCFRGWFSGGSLRTIVDQKTFSSGGLVMTNSR